MHSLFHRGRRAPQSVVVAAGLILSMPVVAVAQRYSFEPHGADLGLKNLDIQLLHQDRSGFLWAATRNGLYRYDAYRFQVFDQRKGIPSARVVAFAESQDGTLWAATAKGLVRRVGEHFEAASLSAALNEISGLAIDPQGKVFVATHAGLAVSQPPTGKLLDFRIVDKRWASAVVIDPAGEAAWFSCGQSICRYAKGNVEDFGKAHGLPAASWRALRFDHQGRLWTRTEEAVYRSDGHDAPFHQVGASEKLLNRRTTPFLYEDRAGAMWTNASIGAIKNEADKWTSFGPSNGLASDGVSAVLEDREGSIWFGFDGSGLDRWLGGPAITSFTRAEGLSDDNAQALTTDGAGGVWVGHSTNRIDHGTKTPAGSFAWKSYELPAPAYGVTAMKRIHSGALLVLTRQGAVVCFDTTAGRGGILGKQAGLPETGAIPLRVRESPDGRVTLGYSTGLYEARDDLKFVQAAKYPDEIEAVDVVRDIAGRVWVAHSGGLLLLERGAWQKYTEADNLAPGGVERLTESPNGEIWLSYREAYGVARLRPESGKEKYTLDLVHFRKGKGITSDSIQFLKFDSHRRLWAGSDQGVDVYDGKSWSHFGQPQGLIWEEVNPHSAVPDSAGAMWIGTKRGLTLVRQSSKPPVPPAGNFISGIDSSNGLVDPALPIVLSQSASSLTIRFTSLNFAEARAMRYRYRILGVSKSWIETAGHQVMLSHLRPGQYRFELQSRPPGGLYGGTPAKIGFTVAEPWAQTPWARVLLVAIVMAILGWLIYKRRMARMYVQQRELEVAVSMRTQELRMEKARVFEEKARVEQEKLRAERQNREIERLLDEAKQASRLKGEFLANMSHEIRTPMNGIIGMINLALATPLVGDQRDYVDTAKNSAEALLSILNDVLDFSKVEAGHLAIEAEPFSLRDIIAETCKVFQPRASERDIALSFTVATDVPATVVSDPGRIRQILLNLVGNSIKFTHEGHVKITVMRQHRSAANKPVFQFTVEDTGIGISADKQKVVFEAFRQADGSTTRRYGGTGLGLAISMKLVSLLGGRLWVDSEPGKGSRFHFTITAGLLDVDDEHPTTLSTDMWRMRPPTQQPGSPARPLKVLLAEDNLVNQRVAARMLEMRGHHVKVVDNGAEALQSLDRGEVFDLILMDVQMPEMDGIEATRLIRVREELHGGHIPIVAMTAHTMKGDRERCLTSGMDGYVNKPIEPASFFKTVEGIVPALSEHLPDGSVAPH